MANLKNIKEYIRALEHITHFLKQLVEEETKITEAPVGEIDRLTEFTDLRMMVKSDIWPDAIEPSLISAEDNEEDQINRADSIIQEYMKVDLSGKKFLDYGCGSGYVAHQAKNYGVALAIGYDPNPSPHHHKWLKMEAPKGTPSPHFTSGFTPYRNYHGEFDIILLYDVLDHAEDPLSVLQHVAKLKAKDGKVFVRCHPWTSRHGTHLYRKANKAYLQLVFSQEELIKMGLKGEYTNKILDPIFNYRKWFSEAGLKIVSESTINQDVDIYFTTRPSILRRIKENWKYSSDLNLASGAKFAHEVMAIQFADFVLE
jgi:2-polyprenyl-3-methyl-5-hydroxy-6-metoxy-1,4-benzoquinol methylase